MYNKIIAMWNIFKNDNEWNEKNVVGFIAFLVMVLFALLDLRSSLSPTATSKSLRSSKNLTRSFNRFAETTDILLII